MKFGTKLQFECPDKCPDDCELKKEPFHQGSICTRCPVFCCKMPITEEDKKYLPILNPDEFRDDWAREWANFFQTGEYPHLKL